ncbi:MAG: type II toxin-antitoxin system Phd/YefM family antitoxin [Candidatus Omnitrophica bacterium]|nr:type II toxin-antitoxin system Phd/YefM family antitoxin [Candidatus Omnitrophota bacterium]
MVRLTATEAREHFADTLNRVSYRGERIVVFRRGGKDMAAVVPMEDLETLQRLEDKLDHETIQRALAEPGKRLSYRAFRKTLGL